MTADLVAQSEDRLYRAMLASDLKELDHLISERLIFVTPDGATASKAEDLEAHRTGGIKFHSLVPGPRRIEVNASLAVVTVEMRLAGQFKGTAFAGTFRYLRVWAEEATGPRIVAGSVTPMTA